jgi:hypothetical protein
MREFDTSSCIVHLDSLVHGIVTFQLSSSSIAIHLVHHTTALNKEDIPVAREFQDVFPDDLPGMPPDQDVEFTIDLQSGMTPISRRPYKMAPKELAKLNIVTSHP